MGVREGKLGFSLRTEIDRLDKEIYLKLKEFSTPVLSDAMNRFRAMVPQIKPVGDHCDLIGPAITVRVRPGDNLMVHKAIDIAQPGDVIVIDTGDCSTNAVWGELITRAAIKKGIAGAVIDGAIRDVKEIRELGFPLFAKYVVPSGCDKEGPGEINEPINCGGVVVCPGDIIVGDENGIVVIPPYLVVEVLKNAKNKVDYETRRKTEIEMGRVVSADVDEILRKKGVIQN